MKFKNGGLSAVIAIIFTVCLMVFSVSAQAQERLSVKASVANIRAGAGTNNDVLWQVEKYHPFIVVKKKGKWYRVKDFENDEGWIHVSLLGNTKTVITIREKCNIRLKPTTNSGVLFTAERGVPFRLLKTQAKWLKVEHADGDVGWIFKTLVW